MAADGDAICSCGHERRIHMGGGTCLSAVPSGEASVCPCLSFVPDLMAAALEKSLKDVRDGDR